MRKKSQWFRETNISKDKLGEIKQLPQHPSFKLVRAGTSRWAALEFVSLEGGNSRLNNKSPRLQARAGGGCQISRHRWDCQPRAQDLATRHVLGLITKIIWRVKAQKPVMLCMSFYCITVNMGIFFHIDNRYRHYELGQVGSLSSVVCEVKLSIKFREDDIMMSAELSNPACCRPALCWVKCRTATHLFTAPALARQGRGASSWRGRFIRPS